MFAAIDIGNTNITIGVFEGEKIKRTWRLASNLNSTEDETGILIKNLLKDADILDKVKEAAISSVSPRITETCENAFLKYLNIKPFIISDKIKMNIKLKMDNPKETGADRIANAAAAAAHYPVPAIAVDLGTASAFDVINQNKEFIGGIITAGMKIQLEALAGRTSKLPKLNIAAPNNIIGRNTIDAMLSGIVSGHAAMIEGLIAECEKELGEKAFIIGTGGYSKLISRCMNRKFDCENPDLTLIGIKVLYGMNN